MKGKEVVFSHGWNGWATPKDLFAKLNGVFNFDTDLAASAENALCPKFFTEDQNSLVQDWTGVTGWLNPPYSIGKKFVLKCLEENNKANLVCLLLPARVDTQWFHMLPEGTWVFFFKGRLKFGTYEKNSPAPFPSCLVFFGKNRLFARSLAHKAFKGNGKWLAL